MKNHAAGKGSSGIFWHSRVIPKALMPVWIVVVISTMLIALLIIDLHTASLRRELEARADALLFSLAQTAAPAIAAGDYDQFISICERLTSDDPTLLYVTLDIRNGYSMLFSNGQCKGLPDGGKDDYARNEVKGRTVWAAKENQNVYHCSRRINDRGSIHVGLSMKKYSEDVKKFYLWAIFISAVYLLLLSLTSFLFFRRYDRSVTVLLDVTRQIREGAFSARAGISGKDELGSLEESINQIADTLERSLNELKEVHASIEVSVEQRTVNLLKFIEYLKQEVAEHKESERKLKESEERYRNLLICMPDPLFTLDLNNSILFVNPAMERLSGFTGEQLVTMNISELIAHEYSSILAENIRKVIDGTTFSPFEIEIIDAKKRQAWIEIHISRIVDSGGNLTGIQGLARDINEEKNLQKQLFHSQKMEAIGTFAEGIAHDFNNILTIILGNIDLALMKLPPEHQVTARLNNANNACDKAKNLIAQLLQFGRPDTSPSVILSMNSAIDETDPLLDILIPGKIEVLKKLAVEPCYIKANPALITQIITNLCINARDVMPEGGILTIETSLTSLDASSPELPRNALPGNYCVLRISDTGTGMSMELRERIFEPFFTTKKEGKGSGLGLPVVYGIVKNLEGWINVRSEPGKGTTFEIYLPESDRESSVKVHLPAKTEGGRETILMADDDEAITAIGREALEKYGYAFLSAMSTDDALSIFREQPKEIDLAVLDIDMPGGGGMHALDVIRSISPELPIIMISGRDRKKLIEERNDSLLTFLSKPFKLQELAMLVREMLDRKNNIRFEKA